MAVISKALFILKPAGFDHPNEVKTIVVCCLHRQHTIGWKETYQNSPDALECVQHLGDMVFVPDMWGHAVINLREGVGVASEFIYGASEFSI